MESWTYKLLLIQSPDDIKSALQKTDAHIENKTAASKRLMIMLNSNLRGMQAPKPKLSKWAYTGVVRPKLLYTCITLGNSVNTIQQQKL